MKNKAFKILLFVALFLAIIVAWLLITDARNKKLSVVQQDQGLENPFGTSEGGQDLVGESNQDNSSNNSSGGGVNQGGQPSSNITVIENNPALKQLSQASVAGFTFVDEERIIETPEITEDSNIVETYDFSGYRTLRFEDRGDEVVKVKTVLNRQNPSPNLVVNAEYDTDMKNAVVEFQNSNGLSGDGVIGPNTYKKLNEFQGITTFSNTQKPANTEIVQMVRYVDVASGIIFDRATRREEDAKPVTDTPVPRVVEAMFDNTGLKAVYRYLQDEIIQTYVIELDFPEIDPNLTQEEKDALSKAASIEGDFLPENISYVDVSPDKKSLVYLNPVAGGNSLVTYSFANGAKKEIWASPFTEWIVDWGSANKINLNTKASAFAEGYSYSVDSKTGNFYKNIGDLYGLTSLLSPDGKKLLYTSSENGEIKTYILDIASNSSEEVSPQALPEKCVWTKDSSEIYCAAGIKGVAYTYPDDWYKGKISFDDAVWVIDADTKNGNILYDIVSKTGKKIDAINLQLNSNEDYLGFINKKDGTLWGFDLIR